MPLSYPFNIPEYACRRILNAHARPFFLNFILTYRCNAQCVMCNIWKLYREDPGSADKELSLAEIERFISGNLEELSQVRNIGFTGGEPLLMRQDFVQIVKIFREYLPKARMGVQTNGLNPQLARERLKEILSFYPGFSLAVSLDGITELHSRVRGIPQAFEKAVETVRCARELGIRNITSGMTLNKYNYDKIEEVKDYADRLGVEFSCFLAEDSDYFQHNLSCDMGLSNTQLREIISQLRECCGYHYFMDNLRLLLEGARKRSLPCYSGFASLVIDPYGNVKPCVLKVRGINDDTFGNIRESGLKEILSSPRASRIRKAIKKCSCWCQCEVSSSAVISPLDVIKWFVFHCRERKNFLGHIRRKTKKYSSYL